MGLASQARLLLPPALSLGGWSSWQLQGVRKLFGLNFVRRQDCTVLRDAKLCQEV